MGAAGVVRPERRWAGMLWLLAALVEGGVVSEGSNDGSRPEERASHARVSGSAAVSSVRGVSRLSLWPARNLSPAYLQVSTR